ncbi:short-chain dehydrogenase [Sporanaerobium hydrogeniformans]|uniref:Short-chain dehydrogenase n=1 Tax=Sporanaerobium hydrogeniformans TaxID=3072179 RepID=A0AC61DDR5_9FIRM|nr:SDR family oxidoreductase [Sporanaerobium hydrogeniformans]PHV70928.1 short-chain dehydrogenase [Sporanaerobium hydrogeniformans]
MKEYVLITGASSGIGYELAKEFASNGYSLIVVARREEQLVQLKKQLETENIEVHVIVEDLSEKLAPYRLFKKVTALEGRVRILINNAGAGYVGEFLEQSEEKERELLELNIVSLTQITKLFAREMKKQGGGKILNVASTGAYHPGAYIASYYAAKAYVLSFTEALQMELAPYHIEVAALCPGATKTEFARRAGRQDAGIAMSAEEVAKKAYRGLVRGKKVIFPSVIQRLFVCIPRRWAKKLVANYQRKLMIEESKHKVCK